MKRTSKNYFSARHAGERRGIAVIELAVCLPILVFIVFATIEACTMIYLRQRVKASAYEGARIAITPEVTTAKIEFYCETLLDSQNVLDYSISVEPSDPTTVASGDFVSVTITAPYASNSLIGGWLYSTKAIAETVSLPVE